MAVTKAAPAPPKGKKLVAAVDKLIIKPDAAQDKSDGGIVLPDDAKEKPTRGEILSVGKGRVLETGARAAVDYAVGDVVLYGRYDGTEVKVGGETRVILSQGSVLAKIE